MPPPGAGVTPTPDPGWPAAVDQAMAAEGIRHVVTVPDGGLTELLVRCVEAGREVVTLTTEEEGVAFLAGAWLGGERGVLLMQSSGVGNCINMLTLPRICRMPCVMVVTMRGTWGEFNPWQIPMGQAVPDALESVGVITFPAESAEAVGQTFRAACRQAYHTGTTVAVLVDQRIVGSKNFRKEDGHR